KILRRIERIATAAPIGESEIQQAIVGAARCRQGIECSETPVVIREGLAETNYLARRTAVVGGGGWIFRRPLEHHRVVRVHAAVWYEVRLRRHVARVGVCVELAVAASAGLIELRMKGKALEAALSSLRLDADSPARRVDVEILSDGLPIVADGV